MDNRCARSFFAIVAGNCFVFLRKDNIISELWDCPSGQPDRPRPGPAGTRSDVQNRGLSVCNSKEMPAQAGMT